MKYQFIRLLLNVSIALLTACGSQDGANTGVNIASEAPKLRAIESINTSANTSSLIISLTQLYPNGQLPSERAAQVAQALAQNPAALKLTANATPALETVPQAIQPQALASDYAPVQRIQNTTLYGAYFFSIYPGEVTTAIATHPDWRLEGPAFWASLATGTDLYPVHRFQNKLSGSYLYTIYEAERADIVANFSDTFAYEGIAWQARQTAAPGWSTLWRFRNLVNGTYLFTAYESEKDAIVRNFPAIFQLEGPAYFVRQDAPADVVDPVVPVVPVLLPTITSIAPISPSTAVLGVSTTFTVVGENLPLTAVLSVQDATCLAASGNNAMGFSQVCTINLGSIAGPKTITVKTASAGTVINAMNTITAQLNPVVTLAGATRVITNTLYTYIASLSNGTASTWTWLWGDGSSDSTGNPASKVWYKPGSYSLTVKTLNGSELVMATPVMTVVGNPISAGESHSCALQTAGTVSCWGNNSVGQLGDGTTVNKSTPTPTLVPILIFGLTPMTGVVAITAGDNHNCALKTDGTVRCWGWNAYGQLGDGSTTNSLTPKLVSGLTGVAAIAAGARHTCALKTDGTVSCWGWNAYGQLGDGTSTDRNIPTVVTGLTGVTSLIGGRYHSCALKTDGIVRCWGDNSFLQLGDGTTTDSPSPQVVPGLTGVASLKANGYHTCALKTDGTARCWGYNSTGQLGDGSTTNKSSPTVVLGFTGGAALTGGLYHTCASQTVGTVRCWGRNDFGQLGDSTLTDKLTSTAVPGLTAAAALTAGMYHSCVLKADGTVNCWGRNDSGQLGDGTIVNKSSPTAVVGGAIFWQ
jgi:alpha-tubulin suppressor-like RCC1 family protein